MISNEIITLSITILGGAASLLWKISKAEENLRNLIGRNHSSLLQEINEVRHDLDKMKIMNTNDHEKFVYRDHSISESLDHKFKRVESWINRICNHLDSRDNFSINRNIIKSDN